MSDLHDTRFPNESDAYRDARARLLNAEIALEEQLEAVSALRRALPLGGVVSADYDFSEMAGGIEQSVAMSDLFGTAQSLFVYSFMFGPHDDAPCPACTSLIDGLNGIADHVGDRIAMAVVAKSPASRLGEYACSRGWSRVRLLSSANNTYNRDYFAEAPDGRQLPAANVFVRRGKAIHHFYSAEQLYVDLPRHPRHVDRLWPIWNIFDLTPKGRGDWGPKLAYS